MRPAPDLAAPPARERTRGGPAAAAAPPRRARLVGCDLAGGPLYSGHAIVEPARCRAQSGCADEGSKRWHWGTFAVPVPENEPISDYAPGSPERGSLVGELTRQAGTVVEIQPRIGGRSMPTGETGRVVMPHAHEHDLARFHASGPDVVDAAIEACRGARMDWASLPFEERAAVFLRAADLLSGPWRDRINAATMLGQSKTAHQSEIDAVAELADFLCFNVYFLAEIMAAQPRSARTRGTASSTVRSTASSWPAPRSISRRSAATSRPPPPSAGTR